MCRQFLDGVLRTNDPFVSQSVAQERNSDIYLVGSKLFVFGSKFAFLLNGGVRGTMLEMQLQGSTLLVGAGVRRYRLPIIRSFVIAFVRD